MTAVEYNKETGATVLLPNVTTDEEMARYVWEKCLSEQPSRYFPFYDWLLSRSGAQKREYDGKLDVLSQPNAVVDLKNPRNEYDLPSHKYYWVK